MVLPDSRHKPILVGLDDIYEMHSATLRVTSNLTAVQSDQLQAQRRRIDVFKNSKSQKNASIPLSTVINWNPSLPFDIKQVRLISQMHETSGKCKSLFNHIQKPHRCKYTDKCGNKSQFLISLNPEYKLEPIHKWETDERHSIALCGLQKSKKCWQ